MDRFVGKVAVVTGSSSGIGKAIATELVKRGLIVVGLARRTDKLQKLAIELEEATDSKTGMFYPVQCDLTKESDIEKAFQYVKTKIGSISILINDAGCACYSQDVLEMKVEDYDATFDTNVKGLFLAAKEAIKSMEEHSNEGHVINIISIAGHNLPVQAWRTIYHASKHAARIVSEGLRVMVVEKKSNIKISNLSPGLVKTELTKNMPSLVNNESTAISTADVAKACISILDTPPTVLISELVIMPIHQATKYQSQKMDDNKTE